MRLIDGRAQDRCFVLRGQQRRRRGGHGFTGRTTDASQFRHSAGRTGRRSIVVRIAGRLNCGNLELSTFGRPTRTALRTVSAETQNAENRIGESKGEENCAAREETIARWSDVIGERQRRSSSKRETIFQKTIGKENHKIKNESE